MAAINYARLNKMIKPDTLLKKFLEIPRDNTIEITDTLETSIVELIDIEHLPRELLEITMHLIDEDIANNKVSQELLFQARCLHACTLIGDYFDDILVVGTVSTVYSILTLLQGYKPGNAIPLLKTAVDKIDLSTGNADTVDLLLNLAENIRMVGESFRALPYLQTALLIAEALNDSRREASVRFSLGSVLCETDDLEASMKELRRAADLSKIHGFSHLFSVATFSLTKVLMVSNRWQEADVAISTLKAEASEPVPWHNVLLMRTIIKTRLMQWNEARLLALTTIAASRAAGDQVSANEAILQQSIIHQAMAEWDSANEELEVIQDEVSDPKALSGILVNRANALRNLGKFQDSHRLANQALSLVEHLPDAKKSEALARVTLGNVLDDLGHASKAEQEWHQALDIAQSFERSDWIPVFAAALGNLGGAYLRRGDVTKAREYLERAIQESLRMHDTSNASRWHLNLSELFRLSSRTKKAHHHAQKAQELAIQAEDKPLLSRVLIARARLFPGHNDEREELLNRAKELANELRDPELNKLVKTFGYD